MNKKKISMLLITAALLLQGCTVKNEPQDANKQQAATEKPRIAVTSVATLEILDQLGVDDVVGIPKTDHAIPDRYQGIKEIGAPMSPDLEVLKTLKPTIILSPISLQGDLKTKYEAAGLNYYFVDLDSVEGMYASIKEMGNMFEKTREAKVLLDKYETWSSKKKEEQGKSEAKNVLILMGLPGSYVVATEHSYVGNLIALAGGQNCYEGESTESFINVNTEDMLKRNPDVIIRTAHALPEQVNKMFLTEFKTNDIWKHFKAVKNEKVFDTKSSAFGMSANLSYEDAVKELEEYLK